jgi:small subunit ribosomal protein S9
MAEETEIKVEIQTADAAGAKADTAAKKRAPAKRKASKKEQKLPDFVKSKRKRAIARASAKSGTGKIRVNGFDINTLQPIALKRLMLEPVYVSKASQEQARRIDIKINVKGGGNSAQAQAVRGAIAKCIVVTSGSSELKREYLSYDRFMLIDDARRVEPKKFKGPKARARFQKSYR